jgi:hypothetical protein
VTAVGPPITVLGMSNVKVTPTTSPQGLAIDGAGNIIVAQMGTVTIQLVVMTNTTLTKFDSQLNRTWSIGLLNFRLGNISTFVANNPLAVDGTGNIYVGGENDARGAVGTFVTKVLPDSTVAWQKTIGSATTNQVFGVAVGADGAISAMGQCSGQLPQQPASASGHGFELKYSSAGDLLQTVQSADIGPYPSGLQLDILGNSFFLNGGAVAKLDPMSKVLWSVATVGVDPHFNLAVRPDGSALFDFEPSPQGYLGKIVQRDSANGAATSVRPFGTQMVTLNAAEGATWTGAFFHYGAAPFMVATNDSIYLAGVYSNTYRNGSSPPPTTGTSYVLRLDSTGKQVWFRLFSFGKNDLGLRAMAIGSQDQLVLLGSYGEILELKASDGTGPL